MDNRTLFERGETQSQVPPQGSKSTPVPLPASNFNEKQHKKPITFRIFKILLILFGVVISILVAFFLFRFASSFSGKEKTVTLIYWGLWEDENVIKTVLSDFEREFPTIKVEYSKQDSKSYRERLVTRIKNGTGPDIFRYHNSWVLMLKDYLLPLPSEVIKKDEFKKLYYPVAQKDLVVSGALYGIPLEVDTLSLFVNTELLKAQGAQAPKTWEEFLATARRLTVPDPETGKIVTSGAAIGTFDNINHAPDIVSLLLIQNGADLKNLKGTIQNASDALDFYTLFAKGENRVWDETLDPSSIAFAKGNVAMYFGYSWDVFLIKALSSDLEFEIHPIPVLPGRNQTIASYWVEGVSAKTKHQKEAFAFMKFLEKKETQQKLFTEASKTRLFGEPYSRTDLEKSLSDNKLVYPFVSQARNAESSFFIGETQDTGLNSQMNSYLGNAVRSILGNTSPQTAIDKLSQGVSQVLNQYAPSPSK